MNMKPKNTIGITDTPFVLDKDFSSALTELLVSKTNNTTSKKRFINQQHINIMIEQLTLNFYTKTGEDNTESETAKDNKTTIIVNVGNPPKNDPSKKDNVYRRNPILKQMLYPSTKKICTTLIISIPKQAFLDNMNLFLNCAIDVPKELLESLSYNNSPLMSLFSPVDLDREYIDLLFTEEKEYKCD